MKQNQIIDLTRRRFISNTAIAGMGLATARRFDMMATDTITSDRRIRLGVVGGRFGLSFFWNLHPNCIVEAVSDLRPERKARLQEVYQCSKSYPSLEEMVKDKNIEAIAIFTEGPNHYNHAMECLRHGKHVISAVPAVMGLTVQEGLDQASGLKAEVERTGLTYMMAETSHYRQSTITVRQMYDAGELGEIYLSQGEYLHPGLRELYFENGQRTWRHGLPPMFYPTHSTNFLIGMTGETLVEVACSGWGDDDPICKDNMYDNNPFWNQTADFRTSKGNRFRMRVWWEGPDRHVEGGAWWGTKKAITDYATLEYTREQTLTEDDAGFAVARVERKPFEVKQYWNTDMLPEPIRVESGHDSSHAFLAHEFIDALVNETSPVNDIDSALAHTIPGIIAHQSALNGGETLKIPVV